MQLLYRHEMLKSLCPKAPIQGPYEFLTSHKTTFYRFLCKFLCIEEQEIHCQIDAELDKTYVMTEFIQNLIKMAEKRLFKEKNNYSDTIALLFCSVLSFSPNVL